MLVNYHSFFPQSSGDIRKRKLATVPVAGCEPAVQAVRHVPKYHTAGLPHPSPPPPRTESRQGNGHLPGIGEILGELILLQTSVTT